MALKLTLKPNEQVVITGAVLKNGDRRTTVSVETRADVLRSSDIMQREEADSPLKEVYYLIQTAMIYNQARDEIVPHVQQRLGKLVPTVSTNLGGLLCEAANHVSGRNYYKALKCVGQVISHTSQDQRETSMA